MLVLARKQGQTIVIDDRIKITVVKVKGSTVRMGIEAPDDVLIRRGELKPLRVPAGNHAA
jgi:carbon storage regulator